MRGKRIHRSILATLLVFALLLIPGAAVMAEEAAESFLVAGIEYVGTFKTRTDRLAAVTGLRAGMAATAADLALAERRLVDTGLYSSVKVSARDTAEGKTITVELAEKWTLVPLPIVSSTEGSLIAGLFLFNSDFLGSGNSLYAGAVGGTDQIRGNLGFSYQPPRNADIGIDLGLSGGYSTMTESDADGRAYAEYEAATAAASAKLTLRKRSALRPWIGGEVRWVDPSGEAEFRDEYLAALPGIGALYDDTRSMGWFREGTTAAAEYRVGLLPDGEEIYQTAELRARISIKAFGRDNLAFGGSGLYGTAPRPLRSELRGSGFRTLPGGESFSNEAASAYVQYEAPMASLSWAVFTGCAFYEAGTYRMGPEDDAAFHAFAGPGAGMRMYLKNIAMPALGIDLAYNQLERNVLFSATLGFSI